MSMVSRNDEGAELEEEEEEEEEGLYTCQI
jgi:hypothetical protein